MHMQFAKNLIFFPKQVINIDAFLSMRYLPKPLMGKKANVMPIKYIPNVSFMQKRNKICGNICH